MARPARVCMRSRKPWVFARRRLFGWKVRLLTAAGLRMWIGWNSSRRRKAHDLHKVRTARTRVKQEAGDAPKPLSGDLWTTASAAPSEAVSVRTPVLPNRPLPKGFAGDHSCACFRLGPLHVITLHRLWTTVWTCRGPRSFEAH